MKQLVALVVAALVVALVVSCGSVPASDDPAGSADPSTATLWMSEYMVAGEELLILGSGFPPLTTVEFYIAGDLWTTVSTSDAGTFMAHEEAPSLPVEIVYAIEAFVGDELWATHPCVTGQ